MSDPVVRFEIGCKDIAATRTFYRSAFGWRIAETPGSAEIDQAGINGALTALGHEPHHYVMVYMQVADIDAACNSIETAGGKITIGPIDIPGGKGRFAWFTDPEGNQLGVFQPPA